MNALNHVVVSDFDGTFTLKSSVSLFNIVDNGGGLTAENLVRAKEMRERYLVKHLEKTLTKEGERNWFHETIGLYAASGLTKKKIYEILSGVKVRPGVRDCLRFLKHKNVPVAIVSYGIEYFIHVVLANNKISELVDAVYSAELIFDEKGLVTGYKPETAIFPDNKGIFSCRFANLFAVAFENILAVGDSGGDAHLGHLKENRLGIAKDDKEKEKLQQFMGEVVITEDFQPVQEWLEKKLNPRN